MDIFGPEAADFKNVRVLNHAFLLRLREARLGWSLRQCMPVEIAVLIEGTTNLQVERLASSPFLLLSLQERDEDFWRSLGQQPANLDMFDVARERNDELLMTSLSFLWQLASRNAYAARLVCGASIGWCERLAERTLLEVLRTAADHEGLLQPRFATNEDFWHKLLSAGLSSDSRVRRSAHVTCLQRLLTDDPAAHYRRLRSAACDKSVPTLSVAERLRRT